METIKKVIEQSSFDRLVFLTFKNDVLIGLNFHQGTDEIDTKFLEPCPKLTKIFNKVVNDNLTLESTINLSIRKYEKKYLFKDKKITIPLEQKKYIQEAIDFYINTKKIMSENLSDSENYKIFDLLQIKAMLNYKTKIVLTDAEKNSFATTNGIDYPNYKV